MAPVTSRKSSPSGNAGVKDVKQRVNICMNKLSDRDTEAMAAVELEAMARDLPADSLPSFLSAISDTRPSDKTPLRRHCLRVLGLLSRARQPQALAPFLPRMLAAVLRRIRDPDSSVRVACVDAVREICRAYNFGPSSSSCAVFLGPLSESLLLEQDANAQMASALCLAAAVDVIAATGEEDGDWEVTRGHDLVQHLHRLVPRLVKLARSDAFKAKPALLTLLCSVITAGGASTPGLLAILVPCFVDVLASDDWAARKSASEALTRIATIPRADLLPGFKSSYLSSFEARRFDKVKAVRDSMNRMLEAWKKVPDALEGEDGGFGGDARLSETVSSPSQKGNTNDGQPARTASSGKSTTPLRARKNKSPTNRSSPTDALPNPGTRRRSPPSTGKRMNQPAPHKLEDRPSDWNVEIAVPQASPSTVIGKVALRNESDRDGEVWGRCKNRGNSGSKLEARKLSFENSEGRTNRFGAFRSVSRVTPVQERFPDQTLPRDNVIDDDKDSELSLIRRQLVQIENQQSSLLDLLQSFMGSSQNGMSSLETRVHGLEITLNELCQDLTVSGRRQNTDPVIHCCRIPGAEFLSSKFRRRDDKYTSKFSIASSPPIIRMQSYDDGCRVDTLGGRKEVFVRKSGFVVNPLAEVSSELRNSNVSSKRMPENVFRHVESQQDQEGNKRDDRLRMGTAADMATRSRR